MTTYVAMLRGINVGGNKKIKMADLVSLFETLGHRDVTTYIQSGNILFTGTDGDEADMAREIEASVTRDLGLDVTVLLRSRNELADVVAANPLPGDGVDPRYLHVTFLAEMPSQELVAAIEGQDYPPDEFRILQREVYLHCPEGYGRTKLNNTFWERKLQVRATTRNWNSVTKLLEFAGGE